MGLKTMLSNAFVRRLSKCNVLTGPFSGMRYGQRSFGSAYAPKLLGCYEKELVPALTKMLERCSRLIDVGAAEGYYAVGFARTAVVDEVVAFEGEASARELLHQTACLNAVEDKISIRRFCTPQALREELVRGTACILMDVEGYERELLDLKEIPTLEFCTILVEIHDQLVPGVGDLIRGRFQASHEITEFPQLNRGLDDFPLPNTGLSRWMPRVLKHKAMDEKRNATMSWFFMTPRLGCVGNDHSQL